MKNLTILIFIFVLFFIGCDTPLDTKTNVEYVYVPTTVEDNSTEDPIVEDPEVIQFDVPLINVSLLYKPSNAGCDELYRSYNEGQINIDYLCDGHYSNYPDDFYGGIIWVPVSIPIDISSITNGNEYRLTLRATMYYRDNPNAEIKLSIFDNDGGYDLSSQKKILDIGSTGNTYNEETFDVDETGIFYVRFYTYVNIDPDLLSNETKLKIEVTNVEEIE